jgi:hypothetical protein
MLSRIAIAVLGLVAQAHAGESALNHKRYEKNSMDSLVDNLINKFIEQVLQVSSVEDSDLDSTRLLKTGPLMTAGSQSVRYTRPAFPFARNPFRSLQYRSASQIGTIPTLGAYNAADGAAEEGRAHTESKGELFGRRHAGLATVVGGAMTAASLPMSALAVDEEFKQGAGIQYRDLVDGTGPAVDKGKRVKVSFVLNLVGADKSTPILKGKDAILRIGGIDDYVPGVQLAIAGDTFANPPLKPMKVGGARQALIPPSLGYGSARKKIDDVVIPPESNLELVVQLIDMRN